MNNFKALDVTTRLNVLSSLLLIFVKLSYEPNVRENKQLVTILNDVSHFQWHLLDTNVVNSVLEWCVTSTEPLIILKLPTEQGNVDAGVLK